MKQEKRIILEMNFQRAFCPFFLCVLPPLQKQQQQQRERGSGGGRSFCSSQLCYAVKHHVPACRRSLLIATLSSISQCSSQICLTPLYARRFRGSSTHRTPTFTEISEACDVLGVDVDCDQRQLKKIYRDLVRKNHPDAGGDEATMSRITVAYDRLSGMSTLEREQFKVQKNAYRGGSYYTSHRHNAGGNNYNSSAGYGGHKTYNNTGGAQSFYNTSYEDYYGQGPARQRGYYTYQQRGQRYGEKPFSSTHPFAFHTQLRHMWTMPLSSIILRGFVVYLGLSIILLLLYRQYRDWLHDDGWKMSESLARHEQLAELHRVRQEMNERVRAAREAAAAHNISVRAIVSRDGGTMDYNMMTSSKGQELRALEYARRRQIEMSEEVKGWPQFGEEKGRLIRRAQDPPGVVFFEPKKEDLRFRQVRNLQMGREWSDKQQNATELSDKGIPNEKPVVVNISSSSTGSNNTDVISKISSIFGDFLGGSPKAARNT